MVLRLGTQAVECVRRIWYSLKTWHIPGKRRALHLPNEILMIIISELTSDGNNSDTSHSTLNKKTLAALASCRLASSTLYLVATPRIFSSILLADTTPRKRPDRQKVFVERATKFNEILTTTSIYNIAASVHTLTLSCIYPDTLNNSINCTLMSVILHRLSHIQKFALESPEFLVFFSSIPGDFASAIQAMCRSPNFTALSLNGVLYFPLTACPNLRCLRLQRANFQSCWEEEILSSQLLSLDSLEIEEDCIYILGSRISEDVSIAKHFSRIKNLQLTSYFDGPLTFRYAWNIISVTSQTLTKLDLSVQAPRTEHLLRHVPFDLGRLPALRHLKIQRLHAYWDDLVPFRFLTQLLSVLSSSSSIEVLEIGLIWYDVREGHGKDLFSSDAGWTTLDHLLTSQAFDSLRKIVLRLDLRLVTTIPSQSHPSGWERLMLKLEKRSTLPYVKGLLPLFRTLTETRQRTLESHLTVDYRYRYRHYNL